MKKKIISICLVGIFFLTCVSSTTALLMKEGTNHMVKIEKREGQIETLEEPDYRFEKVKIELNGKCDRWAIEGSYARPWRFKIPTTDLCISISYCFEQEKIPGYELELLEGSFIVTPLNGEPMIIEYDGDTRIEFVSYIVLQNLPMHEKCVTLKGMLKQGVEIYL